MAVVLWIPRVESQYLRIIEHGYAVRRGFEIVDETDAIDSQRVSERCGADNPVQIGCPGIPLNHWRGDAKASAGDLQLSLADKLFENRFQRIVTGARKSLLPDNRANLTPVRFEQSHISYCST